MLHLLGSYGSTMRRNDIIDWSWAHPLLFPNGFLASIGVSEILADIEVGIEIVTRYTIADIIRPNKQGTSLAPLIREDEL